ncbi:MAG: 4-hydroxythreonine-4-phosphate dehydrogenase, partial [Bryobacterales bacterium]|nr:4-hydroxythreonine-4-phosphate dehydrogenase [Bryobacterales bacterium]
MGVKKPRIALLAGDPTGIGPEVAAKLISNAAAMQAADVVLIGDLRVFRDGAGVAELPPSI